MKGRGRKGLLDRLGGPGSEAWVKGVRYRGDRKWRGK